MSMPTTNRSSPRPWQNCVAFTSLTPTLEYALLRMGMTSCMAVRDLTGRMSLRLFLRHPLFASIANLPRARDLARVGRGFIPKAPLSSIPKRQQGGAEGGDVGEAVFG